MAEISPREQLALHAFSVWYRSTYAQHHPLSPPGLGSVVEAVQKDYYMEQEAAHSPSVEPSIEPPEPEKAPEPPEPEP